MIEPVRVGRHGSLRWRYDGRSSRLAGCMTFTLSGQAEPEQDEQDVGLGCKPEDPPPVTCFLQATFPNTNYHLGSRGSNVLRLTTELRFKVMAPKELSLEKTLGLCWTWWSLDLIDISRQGSEMGKSRLTLSADLCKELIHPFQGHISCNLRTCPVPKVLFHSVESTYA